MAATRIKSKRPCCGSVTRCKRCPVVLKRLESAGLAERQGKRHWTLPRKVKKKQLKRARRRALV